MTPLPVVSQVHWRLVKGDPFDAIIPVLDAAIAPITVTAWTATATAYRDDDDAAVLHEWSAAAGDLRVVDQAVILTTDGAVTETWSCDDALVRVEITDPAGDTHAIAQGVIRALSATGSLHSGHPST